MTWFCRHYPKVALQIRQAAEDPEISISHLSKVIGRDTALSARLIKVVNSPLLRATQEVTDLHTAITRLGTNYSSNLAIGLVMEQIFHARSETVEQKDARCRGAAAWKWQASAMRCAAATASSSRTRQRLGGLVHQIGVLPILTYAEDHYELLSDPVSPRPCDRQHPPTALGDKLLGGWDFPEMLASLPGQIPEPGTRLRQPRLHRSGADRHAVLPSRHRSPLGGCGGLQRAGAEEAAGRSRTAKTCAQSWMKPA